MKCCNMQHFIWVFTVCQSTCLGVSGAQRVISVRYSFHDVSRERLYTDVTQLLIQIAASLLLFLEEEDTFWMMCAIIEDLLPASYYSSTLLGIQVRGHAQSCH